MRNLFGRHLEHGYHRVPDAREAQLLAQLKTRDERMADLEKGMADLQKENALLRQKLDALARKYFGVVFASTTEYW